MTDREKISHLLRRFGLGAGESELARYEDLGVQGTVDQLLNYSEVDEQFPVPPWQFAFTKGSKDNNLDPRVFTNWWCAQMGMSQRPLQHKLAFFWHNLLVVGANKVDYGPMMLGYLQTLQAHASSEFATLLTMVSKTPAMVKYLDGDNNLRGRPNENFAREVMELFTLGIGNYTEADVKQAAKAFSGWWYRYLIFEDNGRPYNDRVIEFIQSTLPMVVYCWIPELHDTGPKTVLGKTANYTGESLIAELADHPITAKRIGTRLWEFFATPNPTPAIQEKMAASFHQHRGKATGVLRDMTEMDEFWSPKCVRQLVKTPLDFVVPIVRQMDCQAELLDAVGPLQPTRYVSDPIRHLGDMVSYNLDIQGLLPLHPENVKGWDWGDAFINTNGMIKRIEFSGVLYDSLANQRLGDRLSQRILSSNPKTDADCVDKLFRILDAELPAEKRELVISKFTKAGGMKNLEKGRDGTGVLVQTTRILFAAPEFQLC